MKKILSTLLIGIALSAAFSMANAQYVAPKSACDDQALKEWPADCAKVQKAFVACADKSSQESFERCVDANVEQ